MTLIKNFGKIIIISFFSIHHFQYMLLVYLKYDIIPLLKKDTITVYIEEEPDRFISPEID